MSQEQEKARNAAKAVPQAASAKKEMPEMPMGAAALVSKLDAKVKVIHGANDEEFEGLVGQPVASVRASLVDAFNIPADAMALVNGNQVDNNYTLQQNDVLEFIKQAGVKG